MLTLDNFEAAISAKIVQRGFDYFKSQAVGDLDEDTPGMWSAVVFGSEDYEVEVELSGRNVADVFCDCPYDGGPHCKHIVAVLYALREQLAVGKKRAVKSSKMTFEDLLLQISLEELRDFIRHQKKDNRDFGEKFMLFFAEKDPAIDVLGKYEGLVRSIIRNNSSKGFMEYRESFAFSKEMRPVLSAADTAIVQKKYSDALAIGRVICREVLQLVQNSDDSAGNVGSVLSSGIQILEQIAEAALVGPELLRQLLDHLEKTLPEKSWFDYGDYGYELLAVAEKTALRTEPESYLNLLDTLAKIHVGKYSDYTQEHFKKAKIQFLERIGRSDEAEKLLTANLDIVEVRQGVVQKALEKRDFAKAKQLIAEGIQIAKGKQHPGTVNRWEEMLLDIARLEKDVATERRLTQKFAFDRGVNTQYYQAWKATFSPSEWAEAIEAYIQSVFSEEKTKPRGIWGNSEQALFFRLSPIFIQEGQWERLLQLIPKAPSESTLATAHPHLAHRYPQEMLAFYSKMLYDLSEKASSRSEYQRLAGLMKKVKQDIEGSSAAMDVLAADLIQKYPRRPAMAEEMRKVAGR